MSQEQISRQPQGAVGSAGGTAPPDLNAETYPFELVQHLLDQAAYFNLFSVPDPPPSGPEIRTPWGDGAIVGLRVNEELRRFNLDVRVPSGRGVKATNIVGEAVGRFEHRWMIIPSDFEAQPGREPPPTPLDASRAQRFVMLDSVFRLGDGEDGFRGFGTGATFPTAFGGGSRLLVAAVGNILEGFGRFGGREGTYTYCGLLDPRRGFTGNLMCRVLDPEGLLQTESDPPALNPFEPPESGLTYLMFRGQKRDRTQKTEYTFAPDGQPEGFTVEQQLRAIRLDVVRQGRGRVRAVKSVGQVIGRMTSRVFLNILNPGAPGTALAPIPFHTYNEYTLTDSEGRTLGSFAAEGGEGRTFNLRLTGAPGQMALRFGAFQRLTRGTGCFSGVEGLLTDNSAAGVSPHALSTLYVLCINDPDGRYRAGSDPVSGRANGRAAGRRATGPAAQAALDEQGDDERG